MQLNNPGMFLFLYQSALNAGWLGNIFLQSLTVSAVCLQHSLAEADKEWRPEVGVSQAQLPTAPWRGKSNHEEEDLDQGFLLPVPVNATPFFFHSFFLPLPHLRGQ